MTTMGEQYGIIGVMEPIPWMVNQPNWEALKRFVFEYTQPIFQGRWPNSRFGTRAASIDALNAMLAWEVAYEMMLDEDE